MPRDDLLPENSRIVTPDFLKKASNRKDLIRRLRQLSQVLKEDESLEAGSDEWPGLEATSMLLVEDYVTHRDKDVRLLATLSCLELLAVYAPEIPWDDDQVLAIFRQLLRQLGNLAHTTSQKQANYATYVRMLTLLAEVRMGCLLVEAAQNEDARMEDCLVDLTRTLLHVLHHEHAHEVTQSSVMAIVACLEEYEDLSIPTKLLDEILLPLTGGPTLSILAPPSGSGAPQQVQVRNPTYHAAAQVVVRTQNKTSTAIASLLNAILHNDPAVLAKTSIATDQSKESVWNIIYQLHRVAPNTLTTVVGNVSDSLQSPEATRRLAVVRLLGRLFSSTHHDMASKFHLCFLLWIKRAGDVEVSIRKDMVVALCKIGRHRPDDAVMQALCQLLVDPHNDVRMAAIQEVADLAFGHPMPAVLLQALGGRIQSRLKAERKAAVTGLSRIYFKHYISTLLSSVQVGGDDVSVEVVLRALHEGLGEADERYGWIPTKIFQAACFTDVVDTDMRSRVVQIVDEMLLGSDKLSSSKKMSSTARAVGLAVILHSIHGYSKTPSNAVVMMRNLLEGRADLQTALRQYIAARAQTKQFEKGSEKALASDARAMELLEQVASLTAPPADGKLPDILQAIHSARDKHIFRILSTIAKPTHSGQARNRAFEELPKRTRQLGKPVAEWVKNLVRRSCMGDFINLDIISHCVLLARESFHEEDLTACVALLQCVDLATFVFPGLCNDEKTFITLTELFAEMRSSTGSLKKGVEGLNLITMLSGILSRGSSAGAATAASDESGDGFQAEMLQLCTKDGTPEQARNAVYTLVRSYKAMDAVDCAEELNSLIRSLTVPSRLSVAKVSSNSRLVSALAALSAFTTACPELSADSDRVAKAFNLVLEGIVMGRRQSDDLGSDDSNDDDSSVEKARTPRQNRSFTSDSPKQSGLLLDDEDLSITCRSLCAAIEFLASHLRSVMTIKKGAPSDETIGTVFELLARMIRDKGMPASSSLRTTCNRRQELAAVRQTAATHLLRLCDGRVGLHKKFLTTARWQTLSQIFLDEERVVRQALVVELGDLLSGGGAFGEPALGRARPPDLRFVAYVVLCSDGDHNTNHDTTNGNAANLGSGAHVLKSSLRRGIELLRSTCDAIFRQCKQQGREDVFEKMYKHEYMPEYSLPYALYLLSGRKETTIDALVGGALSDDDDDVANTLAPSKSTKNSQIRMIRRRLKLLLEPLILSLGDRADNISFLMRVAEFLVKEFVPVPIGSSTSTKVDILRAQVKVVCKEARDVLLGFVKTDVNLVSHPGQVMVPVQLFVRKPRQSSVIKKKRESLKASKKLSRAKHASPSSSPTKMPSTAHPSLRKAGSAAKSPTIGSRVQFSPEVKKSSRRLSRASKSPGVASAHSKATLGSSPEVPFATIRSTADNNTDIETSQSQSLSPPSPSGVLAAGSDQGSSRVRLTQHSSQGLTSSETKSTRASSKKQKSVKSSRSEKSLALDPIPKNIHVPTSGSTTASRKRPSSECSDLKTKTQEENIEHNASRKSRKKPGLGKRVFRSRA